MSNYWSGADEFTKALRERKAKADAGARKGVLLALRNVLNVSNKSVPHEEGDLERDGGVSMDDARIFGAVSYGRRADTAKYAETQHERMDYHHDAGRGPKFLENAFNSTKAQSAEIIAAETKRGMAS